MTVFLVVLLGVTTLYVLAVFGITAITLVKRDRPVPNPPTPLPRISIIVAARNEERDLPDCLTTIVGQNYPRERLEIIVANDHSSDGTSSVIHHFAARYPYVRELNVSDDPALKGKPRALHEAIEASAGEIVLITDADCRPPPQWAANMVTYFGDRTIGMVCGVTLIRGHTLLDRIQALDWMLLLAIASATVEMGMPITAMGNNMAFRREAYDAVGGYPALPFSVTEDYALLRAIHDVTYWRVRLPLKPELRNVTLPVQSIRGIYQQRKRWARGGLRAPVWVFGVYLTAMVCHMLLFAGFLVNPAVALGAVTLKLSADFALLAMVSSTFETRRSLVAFPLFEIYFSIYLLILPFALLFTPRIAWKDRRF